MRGSRKHIEYKEEEKKKKRRQSRCLKIVQIGHMCYIIIKLDKEAGSVTTTRL